MTSYILDVTTVKPLSKNKAKQAVILCHGYGGDGKDISTLAINWQRFLPDTTFICPNAPEVCAINPQGFQWFDLATEKEDVILEKSLLAEERLNIFLDEILNDFQLEPKNLAYIHFKNGEKVKRMEEAKYLGCILNEKSDYKKTKTEAEGKV